MFSAWWFLTLFLLFVLGAEMRRETGLMSWTEPAFHWEPQGSRLSGSLETQETGAREDGREIFFPTKRDFAKCLSFFDWFNIRHRSAFLLPRPGKQAPTFPEFLFQLSSLPLKWHRPVQFAFPKSTEPTENPPGLGKPFRWEWGKRNLLVNDSQE